MLLLPLRLPCLSSCLHLSHALSPTISLSHPRLVIAVFSQAEKYQQASDRYFIVWAGVECVCVCVCVCMCEREREYAFACVCGDKWGMVESLCTISEWIKQVQTADL